MYKSAKRSILLSTLCLLGLVSCSKSKPDVEYIQVSVITTGVEIKPCNVRTCVKKHYFMLASNGVTYNLGSSEEAKAKAEYYKTLIGKKFCLKVVDHYTVSICNKVDTGTITE